MYLIPVNISGPSLGFSQDVCQDWQNKMEVAHFLHFFIKFGYLTVMDLGISKRWCTHYKTLFKVVKNELIKNGVVPFSQIRVVHLHHSGAPKSITV